MRAPEIEDLAFQEEHHWWFRARRRILQAVLGAVAWEGKPRCVVDLGCGAAYDLERLSPAGAWRIGVERAAPALRAARKRLHEAGRPQRDLTENEHRLHLARADAQRLPLRAERADLVLALDLLEHLDDDRAALREAGRILKSGGRLLVSAPAWPFLWSEHDVALEHRRRYRRCELLGRLQEAGFEIERETYFNTLLFVPAVLYRLLRRGWARKTASVRPDAPLTSDTRRLGNCGARWLEGVMAAERLWLKHRRLPFGLSLLVLVRRA